MIVLIVDTVGIHTFTMFATLLTLPACTLYMSSLNVSPQIIADLSCVITVSAAVPPVTRSVHLSFYNRHHCILKNKVLEHLIQQFLYL